MLTKKLIVGSCLTIAMLAGSSAWATSRGDYVTALCPANTVSQTPQALVLCTTRISAKNLEAGTSYWFIPTKKRDSCPPNSSNAASQYSPSTNTNYDVEIGNVAIDDINGKPLPTECKIIAPSPNLLK